MTGAHQPRVLAAPAFAVLIAAAGFVARPMVSSVIDCTTRAEEVAADVGAAVRRSVGQAPTGSSVEACEGGHYVSLGLDFSVATYDDVRAALTRVGCRPSASSTADEFACAWEQERRNIDIVLLRRDSEVTSVVAFVDL